MKHNIAALFDMDGVIVHSNPHHKQAFEIFLKNHNINLSDDELKHHVYGRTNDEIMSYVLKDEFTPEKAKAWADEKEALFRELYKNDVAPVDGLIPFLDTLKKEGIKMAVGTSAPIENLDFVLDSLKIRDYFEALLYSAHVENSKPHPEIYLKAAKQLNMAPEQCVVFEDSLAGVKSGLNAGMKVVGLTTTHSPEELEGAHITINDFSEFSLGDLIKLTSA